MKILITSILLLNSLLILSQDDQRLDYSPFAQTQDEVLFDASVASPYHKYATPIAYYDYEFVETMVQSFFYSVLQMTVVGDAVDTKENNRDVITCKYQKKAIMGKIQYVYTKNTVFINKAGNQITMAFQIYGYYGYVLDFYVHFWPTTINYEPSDKNTIAYNYMLMDKITLKLDLAKQTGTITIINNTFKTTDEYEDYLAQKIKERKEKNNK